MKNTILIVDDFCEAIEEVRESALQSGFGTWAPSRGEVGSSIYEGMNFYGKNAPMVRSLSVALGRAVFPNSMFFRISTPKTEKAYIHSDREWGSHTCVAYLSQHEEISGTAFYIHRKTGLREMPSFAQMKEQGTFEMFKEHMVSGGEDEWEQTDFVRGLFNRAVIFHAPLFHSRFPKHGIGDPNNADTNRMIWGTHFHT